MKRIVLSILVTSVTLSSMLAQIVITKNNYPTIGSSYNMANDDNLSNDIPFSAASATSSWDFTNSLQQLNTYVLKISDPTAFEGYANTSPQPTFVLEEDEGAYFVNTDNGMQSVGLIVNRGKYKNGSTISMPDGIIMMPATAKLNTEFVDVVRLNMDVQTTDLEAQISGIEALKMNSRKLVTAKFDAEGELKLPTGTYTTLRLAVVESDSSVGTMQIKDMGTLPMAYEGEELSYTFKWYALIKNKMVNVLTLKYDGGKELESKEWCYNVNINENVTDVSFNKSSISVYPTFTKDIVNIKATKDLNCKVLINDMTGRVVLKSVVSVGQVNISHLPTGLYSLHVMGNNSQILKVQKIVKQ